MAGLQPTDPSDGRSRTTGSSGGQEKRSGGVQIPTDRELPGSDAVVRGGRIRSREHTSSDQDLKTSDPKPSKKYTLHEYKQTQEAAKAISKLNKKASLANFVFSPTRKAPPHHSPTPSPPPGRGEDSPVRGGEVDQAAVEANYGFMDLGGFKAKDRKVSKSSTMTSQSSGEALQTQLQQSAKNLLNQQRFESLINQGFHVSHSNTAAAPRSEPTWDGGPQPNDSHGNGSGVRQAVNTAATGLPPEASVGMPRADLFTLLMLDMNSKYADMQQKQMEFLTNVNKTQAVSTVKATSEAAGSDSSDDEDGGDEGLPSSWSGLPPSAKQSSFSLSDKALECWSELIAIDEQGKKDLRFKKLPKYPNKIKFYTEGDNLAKFRCPKQNQELAVTGGWRAKQEDEMISLQKFSGAAGSAICLSVDNLRGTMEDLVATMNDFKEAKFEDPGAEAEKICSSLITLLEEGVVTHMVDALKFVSASFGAINLRRHTATLSQGYLSTEAKSVLEQSPPDEEYLFGQQVKESVQKIRDTSLIKDVFNKKPIWTGNKYSGRKFTGWGGNKYGGAKAKKQKKAYRPYDQRFKKGWKKKYDFGENAKDKKSDKKRNNDD